MEITGPFVDRAKKRRQAPACWYFRYATPKLNPDGTSVLDAAGKIVLKRHQPYYESKAKAEADKPSIREKTVPVSSFIEPSSLPGSAFTNREAHPTMAVSILRPM